MKHLLPWVLVSLGLPLAGSLGYSLHAMENAMHWGRCTIGPQWQTCVWPLELGYDGTLTVRTGYAIDGVMIRRVVKK